MSELPPDDQKHSSVGPPQPKLDYQTPQPGRDNTPRQVMLRMVLGVLYGFTALASGMLLLMAVSLIIPRLPGIVAIAVFLLPLMGTFVFMLFVSLRQRRYGYVTGVLLGPFVLVMTAAILLLMICGGRPF